MYDNIYEVWYKKREEQDWKIRNSRDAVASLATIYSTTISWRKYGVSFI